MSDAIIGGKDRIAKRFAKLKAEGRAGLVTFITAGDPDPEASFEILKALPEAGADVIELGMPFSDPMADGPTIQACICAKPCHWCAVSAIRITIRQSF